MAPDHKTCKLVSTIISFIWTLVLASLTIHNLVKIHDDFNNILDSIPDPQIRIVNDDQFLGPIHIICAPSMIKNSTNCDDILNTYDPITSTQQYFSWLYLDPTDPVHNTTTLDIQSARYALFILLAIGLFSHIIETCCKGICDCVQDDDSSDSPNIIVILLAKLIAKFGVNISHMFICNVYSLSEVSEGLYMLEYIPSWAYWALFITIVVWTCCFPIWYIFCDGIVTMDPVKQMEQITNHSALLCPFVTFNLIMVILFGISQYGLYVYIFDFNTQFKASAISNYLVILRPEYLSTVDALKKISISFGVGNILFPIFDCITDCIHHFG